MDHVSKSLDPEPSFSGENRPRYDSATQAYRRILYEEGMRGGLYKGYLPNLIRNSVISATELVNCDLAVLLASFVDRIARSWFASS